MIDGNDDAPTNEDLTSDFITHPPTDQAEAEEAPEEETEEEAEDEEGEADETEGNDEEEGDEEGDGPDEDEGDGDDDENEGDEDEDDNEADGEAGDDDTPPKKKKVVPAKNRIKHLTLLRRDADRRADLAEERELDALKRIKDLEKRLPADAEDGKDEQSDEAEGDDTPKKPNADDFKYGEIDPDYVEALTDYRVDKKLADRDKAVQEADQATVDQEAATERQTMYDEKVVEGKAKYEDFDEVVVKGADKGKYPLTQETALLALESPVGHDVLYKIATSPKLAAKIAQMSERNQAKEFGRLEAQFKPKGSPKTKKATATTKPAPRRKSNVGVKTFKHDTSSFAESEARWNAKRKKRRS